MRSLLGILLLASCGGGDDTSSDLADASGCPPLEADWNARPDVGLGAIQETAAVALDDDLYVLGGFDGSLAIVDAVQVFDTTTCAWSRGPELPAPMHHANAAVVGDTIYVLGYATGFDFAAHGDVYALEDGAWVPRASMPPGTERSSAAVGVIDGAIVVAGGLRGGNAVAEVSRYDAATDTWTALDPLPAPRDHGCGGAVDGTLYVAGGRLGDPDSHQPDTFAFDGAGWTSVAPMLTGRGGTACGVVGGNLIVVGGEGNPDDPSGVFAQAEAYDPATNTWSALPAMPTPRHGMAGAVVGDALYVPGGATQQLFGATAVFDALRI